MRYAACLLLLMITSAAGYCQVGTTKPGYSEVKTVYLDKLIQDKRLKDVYAEKIGNLAYQVDTLKANNAVLRDINNHLVLWNSSIRESNAALETKVQNFEGLYKLERARKRRKGFTNIVLLGGAGFLGYIVISK